MEERQPLLSPRRRGRPYLAAVFVLCVAAVALVALVQRTSEEEESVLAQALPHNHDNSYYCEEDEESQNFLFVTIDRIPRVGSEQM